MKNKVNYLAVSARSIKAFAAAAVLILTLVCLPIKAHALNIDTGTPAGDLEGAYTLSSYQYLAAHFDLYELSRINSITGYMGSYIEMDGDGTFRAGTLTLAVYGSATDIKNNPVPNVIDEVFSYQFAAGVGENWYGITPTNRELAPGSYWAVFEVRGEESFNGIMRTDVPNPVTYYAYANHDPATDITEPYVGVPSSGSSNNNFGFRLNATPVTEVPEPATMLLLGLGLVGLVGFRRKM